MFFYVPDSKGRIVRRDWSGGEDIPESTLWIDLLNITSIQEKAVEDFLGVAIPTREEMSEIEVSNRLYTENNVLYMTATVLSRTEADMPENHSFTFIFTGKTLVSVRYEDTKAFRAFSVQLERSKAGENSAASILIGLIDALVNGLADTLEIAGHDLDSITHLVFCEAKGFKKRSQQYQSALSRVGLAGDLIGKARESLVSLARLVAYAAQSPKICGGDNVALLQAQNRDIQGLSDHAAFLTSRVSFLLDATIGMLGLEQNNIMRIFSIAAVILMPPTLIAGIYGMNFRHMPELNWVWGYPFSMVLIVASAALPYLYFRQRRWL